MNNQDNHELSKQEITEQYDFDERQADYYANSGRYLGLIERNRKATYSLSDTGRKIINMNYKKRQLAFCERILSHRVFHEALKLYFTTGRLPDIKNIIAIMKEAELCKINSDETFNRRSGTIRGWLNWITRLITACHDSYEV